MSKIGVKFVEGGKVYVAEVEDGEFCNGDKIVVESVRGLEMAYVSELSKNIEDEEIIKVIRLATKEDEEKALALKAKEDKVVNLTNELIKKYSLQMKLVDVNYTLDGSKVIINYVCEDRVDFRELVKDLASQLKLRIELRQIGIRDQAKKIGGIGFCGKECCCKKYLNDFDKVSIKMAKTQGLSLNPTKISGICGRLMCCLAYENDAYSEMSSKMPKLNAKVKTPDGVGSVVYNNILKQIVTVRIDSENESKTNEYELEKIEVLPKENALNNTMQKENLKPNKEDFKKSKESMTTNNSQKGDNKTGKFVPNKFKGKKNKNKK